MLEYIKYFKAHFKFWASISAIIDSRVCFWLEVPFARGKLLESWREPLCCTRILMINRHLLKNENRMNFKDSLTYVMKSLTFSISFIQFRFCGNCLSISSEFLYSCKKSAIFFASCLINTAICVLKVLKIRRSTSRSMITSLIIGI